MVTINSKTPCLSEATEATNQILVKLPLQFLINKITTSFDNIFDQLSTNNSFEAEKFEPDPTFERTMNEIKNNHLKIIASSAKNPSTIASFDKNFYPIFINKSFKAAELEPEPTFENTINEIKANHLEIITSIDMNVSDTTSRKSS